MLFVGTLVALLGGFVDCTFPLPVVGYERVVKVLWNAVANVLPEGSLIPPTGRLMV